MKTLLLTGLMGLALFGASHTFADHRNVRVHFVSPGYEHGGFWETVADSMRASANQLGIDVTVSHSDREWPLMRDNALRAIADADDLDYLILVNEHQQAADLVAQADAAGINTFLLLNTLMPEQEEEVGMPRTDLPHWLGSLTPDNHLAGREMAESILSQGRSLKPEKDTLDLLTLAGDFVTPASLYRLAGLDEVLAQNPDVQEHRRLTVNWSREEAERRVDAWLQAGGSFDLIWAANDPIALGAMDAAERHGLQAGQDFSIVGLNWSSDVLARVQSGDMTLTHGGHFLAGAWSMVLLYDYHHEAGFGASEDPHRVFPMSAITRDIDANLFELLASEHWDRLDYRRFSRHLNPEQTEYDFSIDAIESAIVTEHR